MLDLINDINICIKEIKNIYDNHYDFPSLFEEEDIDQNKLQDYILRATNDIIQMAHRLKENNSISFQESKFTKFIEDIINLNTEFHNDKTLSSKSKSMQNILMSNLAILNSQIIKWNNTHEQHIPTLKEIREKIKSKLQEGLKYFEF